MTEQVVDDWIVDIVARTRLRYRIPDGCSGVKACELIGLRRNWGNFDQQDGFLNDPARQITINRYSSGPGRLDFTIYHEIFHWLLNNEEPEIIEFYTAKYPDDADAYNRAIERCCNRGAAEFLLPRQRVREAIAADGLSIELIERLAATPGCSLQSTVVTVATNAPVRCYIAICAYGTSSLRQGPWCLHIEIAARHPSQKHYWAPGTPIPDDHLFAQVWKTKQAASGPSPIVLYPSGRVIPCEDGEAKIVGRRLVGILYPAPS